jgi:hypothetical protein
LWVPKKWLLNCMITNSWLWITIFARLSSPLLLLLLWVAWSCFGPFDSVAYHTTFCIAENSGPWQSQIWFFWVVKCSSYTGWERPLVIHPIPWESHGSEPWHPRWHLPMLRWHRPGLDLNKTRPSLLHANSILWVTISIILLAAFLSLHHPSAIVMGFILPKLAGWYPWSSIKCLELGDTSNFHPSFRMVKSPSLQVEPQYHLVMSHSYGKSMRT